jgi:hypothetical protein
VWNFEISVELLKRVKTHLCPPRDVKDTLKFSTRLENIDWEQQCIGFEKIKSNQMKSNPKYSKICFGFEKFFNSMI